MSIKEAEYICGLKHKDFQTTINGKKTDLYILKNALVRLSQVRSYSYGNIRHRRY